VLRGLDSFGLNQYGSPVNGLFDVRRFGAVGDGVTDDTAAINRAISWAAAQSGGTVYFPEGVYACQCAGSAQGSVYKKAAGAWGAAVGTWTKKAVVDTVVFLRNYNPTGGANGDIWLNYRTGIVWIKAAGVWSEDGSLFDRSGTGWLAGQDAPSDDDGENGDYFFEWLLVKDAISAFNMGVRHSNITFLGDGKTKSVLKSFAWGLQDPSDYEVTSEVVGEETVYTIVYSNVAKNKADGGGNTNYNHYKRGGLFEFKGSGTVVNTHFVGLKMDGGTVADGKHGHNWTWWDLIGWDLHHKCLTYSYNETAFEGCSILDCDLVGWRGEIVYSGGPALRELLIEDTEIHECNGSAISFGGQVTARRCHFHHVYNGIESFLFNGHYHKVQGCLFEGNNGTWRGSGAVVIISTHVNAYAEVDKDGDTNTIIDGFGTGVFLSESGQNCSVKNTIIRDCYAYAIYPRYIGQGYDLVPNFDNLLVQDVQIVATDRNLLCGLDMTQNRPANNWLLERVTISSTGAFKVVDGIRYTNDGSNGGADWTIKDCDFSDVSGGSIVGHNPNDSTGQTGGIAPVYAGTNVMKTRILNPYGANGGVFSLQAMLPEYGFRFIPADGLALDMGVLSRYHAGFTFEFRLVLAEQKTRTLTIASTQDWHSMETDLVLDDFDAATFQFNGDTGVFDLVAFEDEKYAP